MPDPRVPERLAYRCLKLAQQAEREVVAVYDLIDETLVRVPALEAQLVRAHRELVKLRQCSKLPALLRGSGSPGKG